MLPRIAEVLDMIAPEYVNPYGQDTDSFVSGLASEIFDSYFDTLEVKTVDRTYLEFSETIGKLQTEKTGFLFLGIFSYICAVVGFYYMIVNLKVRYKK